MRKLLPQTVTCSIDITDTGTGALFDPANGVTITITDPTGTDIIVAAAMSKLATGEYKYDYNPAANAVLGTYMVKQVADDITRKGVFTNKFSFISILEAEAT